MDVSTIISTLLSILTSADKLKQLFVKSLKFPFRLVRIITGEEARNRELVKKYQLPAGSEKEKINKTIFIRDIKRRRRF